MAIGTHCGGEMTEGIAPDGSHRHRSGATPNPLGTRTTARSPLQARGSAATRDPTGRVHLRLLRRRCPACRGQALTCGCFVEPECEFEGSRTSRSAPTSFAARWALTSVRPLGSEAARHRDAYGNEHDQAAHPLSPRAQPGSKPAPQLETEQCEANAHHPDDQRSHHHAHLVGAEREADGEVAQASATPGRAGSSGRTRGRIEVVRIGRRRGGSSHHAHSLSGSNTWPGTRPCGDNPAMVSASATTSARWPCRCRGIAPVLRRGRRRRRYAGASRAHA